MTKPIILSVLFFILTALSSFGQWKWTNENWKDLDGSTVLPFSGWRHGTIQKPGAFGLPFTVKINDNSSFQNPSELSGLNLSGADLSFGFLWKAKLQDADLRGANLFSALISGGDFTGADLREVSFGGGINAGSAVFDGANMLNADLGGGFYPNSRWVNANLKSADLTFGKFPDSDFSYADLTGADFTEADIRGANFRGAVLTGAINFDEARFKAVGANYSDIKTLEEEVDENTTDISTIKEQIENGGISPEQAAAITSNTTKIEGIISDVATQFETLGNNDTAIGEQLTSLGQNDILIGEQMTILGENDQSIGEQMATLSQNDETIMAEINAMKAQLQTLVAAVAQKDAEIAEKDEEIAELKQGGVGQTLEQVLEQVQDARTGSVILTPSEDGTVKLKLEIEESSDLEVWENQGKSIEAGFPLAEGKKFLRFALK